MLGFLLALAAQQPLEIRLLLEPRWKLNPGSPTRLEISKGGTKIQTFDRKELEDEKAAVRPLSPGEYGLKGEVYFCKKAGPSFCVKRAVKRAIRVQTGATGTTIEVPLEE